MKLKLQYNRAPLSIFKYNLQLLSLLAVCLTTSPVLGQTPAVTNVRKNQDAISADQQTLGVAELVRTRCSTDGKNVYTEWTGSVYAFMPQQKQQKLFNIIGMNVGRCLQNQQGQWFLTSRELTFYLDPQTNQVLDRWQNPWTGEVVPVVHVANNPVQNVFQGETPIFVAGKSVIFSLDVPLTYPNILASDPKFEDYSPEPLYQAGEFFKFTVPIQQVTNPLLTTAPNVSGTWTRIAPWLPWMKMKGKPGQLVYSASIRKLLRFEQLSPFLQQEITSRLPVYREAPRCFLAVDTKLQSNVVGYKKGLRKQT
ncbi:DUF1838 domain-containing protein [Brasilonema sp. CT11]|nr:DUF1838 domain-containing protein [Brasilonema sp. CT11]